MKFERFSSQAVFLNRENIDTDQIIPARFLKVTEKVGLGSALFADWRSDPAFVLNTPDAANAKILVSGANFGCGSSREHAVWALCGFGFRAVIAPSFADIFRQNALKNGLLPIVVNAPTIAMLPANAHFTVDLLDQTLSVDGDSRILFPIDSFSKTCLLEGLDELGYILKHEAAIAAFEKAGTRA